MPSCSLSPSCHNDSSNILCQIFFFPFLKNPSRFVEVILSLILFSFSFSCFYGQLHSCGITLPILSFCNLLFVFLFCRVQTLNLNWDLWGRVECCEWFPRQCSMRRRWQSLWKTHLASTMKRDQPFLLRFVFVYHEITNECCWNETNI